MRRRAALSGWPLRFCEQSPMVWHRVLARDYASNIVTYLSRIGPLFHNWHRSMVPGDGIERALEPTYPCLDSDVQHRPFDACLSFAMALESKLMNARLERYRRGSDASVQSSLARRVAC